MEKMRMLDSDRDALKRIRTFPALVAYLRNTLDWPIEREDFEDLTFEYAPGELGIDAANAAKIQEIKRLRPLTAQQPWGIFFVKFEPKQLPVVALRRILNGVVLKKRAAANRPDAAAWATDDLLFISDFGKRQERQISFAHFSHSNSPVGVPVLKVLGWDSEDTQLHLDHVAQQLRSNLIWPEDTQDVESWRETWRAAFTLRHREVITTSRRLAERLAELAREIRARISALLDVEPPDGPLQSLMEAFRRTLVHDLTYDGFADMYAQTIAYGLLSARITSPQPQATDQLARHLRTSPFLTELLDMLLHVGQGASVPAGRMTLNFDELGVGDVVSLLDNANMDAVLRDFGDRNPREDPVIHFYELFLSEYDPRARMQRGVFYTPRPVVSYLTRAADEALRTCFGLEDGLADTTSWEDMIRQNPNLSLPSGVDPEQPFVMILDPATGTGTFLVEVIDIVHTRMTVKWKRQGRSAREIQSRWQDYVTRFLLPRLHGYELLMAPYAIAHVKIALKLYETGYQFEQGDRARVFLTNSLEPPSDLSGQLEGVAPALAHEASAVSQVKERQHFTVLLGNPPYSKISSNLTPEARSIVDRYRYVDGQRIRERGALQFEMNLQDDYVKFMRLAEQAVTRSQAGVAALITNNGYLSTPTLRGMRESLSESFDSLWLLDLHGHLARGETGPDGRAEENVFDILQGVGLSIGVHAPGIEEARTGVNHTECYGSRQQKYAFLEDNTLGTSDFQQIRPSSPFHLLIPQDIALRQEWQQYCCLPDIFPKNSAGIITARDALVISSKRAALAERLERFSQARKSEAAVYKDFGFSPSKRFDLRDAQRQLRKLGSYMKPIRRLLHRPFDERWIFYDGNVVWSLARPIADQMVGGKNLALLATRQVTRPQFEHAFVSRHMIEIKACSHDRNTQIFPLFLRSGGGLAGAGSLVPNISEDVARHFADELQIQLGIGGRHGQQDSHPAQSLMAYVYAILYAPAYRERYFEFLRSEFPRIPLPGNVEVLESLAILGYELISLHLLESSTLETSMPEYVGPKSPEVGRVGWSDGIVLLDAGTTRGRPPEQPGFVGVPEPVWNFRVGGYQVCHKWLKDRKGQTLTGSEILHYRRILAALTETTRVMSEIDDVVAEFGGWPNAFA